MQTCGTGAAHVDALPGHFRTLNRAELRPLFVSHAFTDDGRQRFSTRAQPDVLLLRSAIHRAVAAYRSGFGDRSETPSACRGIGIAFVTRIADRGAGAPHRIMKPPCKPKVN